MAEQLTGTRRYTDGELWRIADVDEEQLDPELVSAVELRIAEWTPMPASDVGVIETWIPEGWTNRDCNENVSGNETHVWNDESRVAQSSPFDMREVTGVKIVIDLAGSSGTMECSGVFLRARWILTAAHCLEAQDNSPTYDDVEEDIAVVDVYGNSWGADDALVPGGYNKTAIDHDYDDDWGLIHLASNPSTVNDSLDLWDGPDSTYENIGSHVHLIGYPP